MAKRKKAAKAANLPNLEAKIKNNNGIYITVRALFRSGRKLTAKEINQVTGSNDARKIISDLRKEGWNIQDLRLANGCKLYWLVADDRQGDLFSKKGGNDD